MSSKFEKLIEYVVAEDMDKARKLFHELCVDKSRVIYENLLDEEDLDEADDDLDEAKDEDLDESDEEIDEAKDEDLDESDEELDEAKDEDLDESDEDLDEAKDDDLDEGFMDDHEDEFSDEIPSDDMIGDIEADEFGMQSEMDGEENIEDRVVDLEDALDELNMKFAEIIDGGEYGDDEMGDELGMEFGGEEEGEEDEFSMDNDNEFGGDEEEEYTDESMVREYVETVPTPSGSQEVGKGGSVTQNNKSPIAQKRDTGSIDIGKGKKTENPTPSSDSFADGMDPKAVGKKVGKGPKQSAPKPVKRETGASAKSPVAPSHN